MNDRVLFDTLQRKVLTALQAKTETVKNATDLMTVVEAVPSLLPCPNECGLLNSECTDDCKKCWERAYTNQSFN